MEGHGLVPVRKSEAFPSEKKEACDIKTYPLSNFIGARMYFSTTHARSPQGRPTRLNLLHVRMPPGYAPSATPLRPSQIHAAFYRQGIEYLN